MGASPQRVAIWCEQIDRFYSLKPIVENLKARGAMVVVHFPDVRWHEMIATYLELPRQQVRDMHFGRPRLSRLLGHLSLFLLGNMGSRRFSNMYARIISDLPLRYRLFRLVTPKFNRSINKVYRAFFKAITRDVLQTDAVLAVTNMHMPYWLASFEGRLFTLVESWDHPVKMPFLHSPLKAFIWNFDLSEDMSQHQGIKCGEPIFPLRLRYTVELARSGTSIERLAEQIKDVATCSHVNMLLKHEWVTYVCSSSSSNWRVFPEELRIMKAIAEWGDTNGHRIYFKPKPNSKKGDLDFLKAYSCASIGLDGTGSGEQMLDDQYHIYRFLLLKKSKLVINFATTFGLESAIVGCPILQVVPSEFHKFKEFYGLSNNPHLRKYFYSSPNCFEYTEASLDIPKFLNSIFKRNDDRPQKYSQSLQKWIQNTLTLEKSIKVISDALCDRL